MPYRRIIVNLFNASQTDVAHIHTLSITRFFFERIAGPDEQPPRRRNTGDTFMVERNVTPEEDEDQLDYEFNPPSGPLSGDQVDQPQENVEDVDEF